MPAKSHSKTRLRSKAQKNTEWIEIPIFIHGITPNKVPATSKREYAALLERVNQGLKSHRKSEFSGEPIYVVWGLPTIPPQTTGIDQHLAEVERRLEIDAKRSMGIAYPIPFPFLGIYAKVRDFFFYGVTDLFYYVSADGERALREHIFRYVARTINQLDRDADLHFSLNLFGHSAGSVISHDLLFHLFSNKNLERRGSELFGQMERLHKMIKEGRLRLRHLYTFGSPITPLTLRADSLINKLISNEVLHPYDIGMREEDQLTDPRWMNFWSRYDLASYPVASLYSNSSGVIVDIEIHTPLLPAAAHASYWKSNEMADHIARSF